MLGLGGIYSILGPPKCSGGWNTGASSVNLTPVEAQFHLHRLPPCPFAPYLSETG
jgi:hypothetical protein